MLTNKNMQLVWLDFHDKSLNFKENIGISAINNHDMRSTKSNKYNALKASEVKNECSPTINEPQNKALAGVGNPMNELLWRGSILNLPNRRAEKIAMIKAV